LGPIWAIVCVLGPATEAVEVKWVDVTLLRALRPDIGSLSSLSLVERVTCGWQRRGGRAPYSAVLLCTSTTRYDPRWSSKLAIVKRDLCKKICTKAEVTQRRSLKVMTYPSP